VIDSKLGSIFDAQITLGTPMPARPINERRVIF
jgi:hypothetical protein